MAIVDSKGPFQVAPLKIDLNHHDTSTDSSAVLLAAHYDQTFSITYDFWRQRNRLFLWLMLAVVTATLLTAPVPEARIVLVALLARQADDPDRDELRRALTSEVTITIIQTALLLVVFYLVFSLYHRSSHVRRLYDYLGKVETDLRSMIDLGAYGFTREGGHYAAWQPKPLRTVGSVYVILIGTLLGGFFATKIVQDFRGNAGWLVLVDATIAFVTLIYFAAYALDSVRRR